jgi:hypothetical protein
MGEGNVSLRGAEAPLQRPHDEQVRLYNQCPMPGGTEALVFPIVGAFLQVRPKLPLNAAHAFQDLGGFENPPGYIKCHCEEQSDVAIYCTIEIEPLDHHVVPVISGLLVMTWAMYLSR